MMNRLISNRTLPRGFTLVELMVAIAVISVLAAIALPAVKNTLQGQRLNRAASTLQAAIAEGRARSIRTGGGGGIIIERIGDESILERAQSVRIRMCDSPSTYSGDPGGTRARFGYRFGSTNAPQDDTLALWFNEFALQLQRSADDLANGSASTLINPGDTVYLSQTGTRFQILSISQGTDIDRNADGISAAAIPIPANFVRVVVQREELNQSFERFHNRDLEYAIVKFPRKTYAAPVDLPKGAAIDLTASGVGRFGTQFSPLAITGNYLDETIAPFLNTPIDYGSIYILFGSRGEISRIILGGVDMPVTGDVHLLVGHGAAVKTSPSDQLEDNDPDPLADRSHDGKTPLLDAESIWVTIRSHSGETLTSQWVDPTDESTNLIPAQVSSPTNLTQIVRIQTVVGLTRSGAVESRDGGSL